ANGSIYKLLNPDSNNPAQNFGTPTWRKLGGNLPNAIVNDIHYDPTDDVLVVGTFGRSAWAMHDFKSKVGQPGVLEIDGDTDQPNENDNITLVLDGNNPLLL